MEWNMIFDMIDPALFIVVGVCWVLGYILKQTPQVRDWTIVYIVVAAAILLAIWMLGFGPEALIQGILAGAFAVFGHQVVKQTSTRGRDDQ